MLFKQEMGVTFTDYLNQVRINRSCELLTNTSLSLIDVSLQAGFDDQSYFSKVFKKIKGVTPKSYRNGNTGK
jgi:YesN/AraC family two-component response regulator